MKVRIILGLVAILALAAVSAFAADGAAIYKSKCQVCHAANGSGDNPAGKSMKVADLRSAAVQKQTDAELAKVISAGKGKMPPFAKKLTTAEIESVIGFVRTLKAR